MGGRTTAEWIVYALGLVATIVVTLVVTRIARRAIREAAPALADGDADETPEIALEPGTA